MFCPTCGSEERQLIQYCRSCGTDLRVVRVGLGDPDALTASALTGRDYINRALADKIREMQSPGDLKKVAEDVLPEIEKFLETPEERRLRRIRRGMVFAAIGFGATLIFSLLSTAKDDLGMLIGAGAIFFFVGIAIIINGLAFTRPRKNLSAYSEARAEKHLDSSVENVLGPSRPTLQPTTNELDQRNLTSVTEHTTHQLKQ
jgi:hypothetical protein